MSQQKKHAVSTIETLGFLDMELEREVFDLPATHGGTIEQGCDGEGDEVAMRVLIYEYTSMASTQLKEMLIDEKDPTPTITLAQANDMPEKSFAFVSENCVLVKQATLS